MQVLRDDTGREVLKFVTPSGVTGIVATSVPPQALDALMEELARKLATAGLRPAKRKR